MLIKRLVSIEVVLKIVIMKSLLLILLIAPLFLSAQSISVVSFRKVQDATNVNLSNSILDRNGDECALIKIITNEKGFSFEGDILGIEAVQKKAGEYWIYIPQAAKSISIMHLSYGVLRNYVYPIPIRKGEVFEMQLSTTTKIEDNIVYVPKWNFIKKVSNKDLKRNPEAYEKINDLADQVASKLNKCCSVWGGKQLSSIVFWGLDSKGNYQTGIQKRNHKLIIVMTVKWYGSITGSEYMIKGKLIVDLLTGKLEWRKITDKGSFPPSCGSGCSLN